MKFQMKLLALAVLGFAATAPAHASIATSGTGNGELFLSVWDTNGTDTTSDDRGFTSDLGTFLTADWASAANTPVFNAAANTAGTVRTYANSALSSWIASSASQSNLHWNVFGGDSLGTDKYLTTISSFPVATLQSALHNWGTAADIYLGGVNALTGNTATSVNSSVATTSADGIAFAGGGAWGSNVGTQAQYGLNNAGGIGQSLAFWGFYETATTSGGVKTFKYTSANDNGTQLHDGSAATWTLASNGTLTYNVAAAPVATVPVPAAAWLLGSGLIGMIGVARRKLAV